MIGMKLIKRQNLYNHELDWTVYALYTVLIRMLKYELKLLNVERKFHNLADFDGTKVTSIFQYAIWI